ncbi:DUF4136 domain-containing protein [Niastella caeni]|uniref:DUF4136 domain-containing protein n=1 Tax=Niastella caeni TaxID=2569763 RepID=A0A4V4GZW1_9BACT|nr:DUF4136 domain-containing protein [Niastella caeni]THU34166.1 DUF4136 domain-containing protein [Niastella caeni]
MNILKAIPVLFVPILLAVSCATPAYIEKDETADFSRYKTYAWIDSDKKEEKGRHMEFMKKHVHEAVNAQLLKEGWREDKSKPDVLISYDMLVEKTTREQSNPVYSMPYRRMFYNPFYRRWGTIYYPSMFMGYDNNTAEVRQGTLTITMVDARTDKTIWQGWTTDDVNSRNVTKKEINSSVNSIFRKFDVVRK